VLAGAVSITAPCAMVQAYGAAIIGVVGGLVYTASSRLLLR
jgi:Amt family ammonium transporter